LHIHSKYHKSQFKTRLGKMFDFPSIWLYVPSPVLMGIQQDASHSRN
jgi:hypothetical protein